MIWIAAIVALQFALVASAQVNVPVAVLINEPSISQYTFPVLATDPFPTSVVGAPWHAGIQLVHKLLLERGGLPVGNQTFHLDTVVYNRAAFSGTDIQFARDMILGAHAPVYVTTMLVSTVTLQEMVIEVARQCADGSRCMVLAAASVQRVYQCTPTEMQAPECINRPNLRRFPNVLSILPNSEYITESFLGRMANKQQRTITVVYNPESGFTADAARMVPNLADPLGLNVVASYPLPGSTCFGGNVTKFVEDVKTANADVVIAIDTATNGACWVRALEQMKIANYFPKAMALCGGILNDVKSRLGKDGEYLIRYVYNAQATMEDVESFDYRATSTSTHTELIPATVNQTSGVVHRNYIRQLYGDAMVKSPFYPYSYFSAASIVVLLHLIELSSGTIDPRLWQSISAQINTPSVVGRIQFDSTGQNLGLRQQLLSQEYLDPVSGRLTSPLVSVTSRYQDIFPAPSWEERTYRTFFQTGDELRPIWDSDVIVMLAASAVLFIGTTTGMFCLRSALKNHSSVFHRRVTVWQWISLGLSFGVAGQWAFLVIAFQSLSFEAVDSSVRSSLHVDIPASFAFPCLLFSVLVLPSAWFYMFVRKQVREKWAGILKKRADEFSSQPEGSAIIELDKNISKVHPTSSSVVKYNGDDGDDGDGNEIIAIHDSDNQTTTTPTVLEDDEEKGFIRAGYDRFKSIPFQIKMMIWAVGMLWTIAPFCMQLVLLLSLDHTHVSANIGEGVWIGYLLMSSVPMAVAFLCHGFVYNNDVTVTTLQCISSMLLYFVSIVNSTFVYVEEHTSSGLKVDSLIGTLVPGLISLFTTIVFVIMLLRKSGADNEHVRRQKHEITIERNLAKQALLYALQELQSVKNEFHRRDLYDRFLDSQRVTFGELDQFQNNQTRQRNHWQVLLNRLSLVEPPSVTLEMLTQYIESTRTKVKKKTKKNGNDNGNNKSPVAASGTIIKVESLFQHPILFEWLRYAARVGGSEENWYFLATMRAFEQIPDSLAVERLDDAWSIYKIFIDNNAPLHINISSVMVQSIHTRLGSCVNEVPVNIFADAKREVINLMQTNNIASLSKIPAFTQAVKQFAAVATKDD